jgi:hypothetical protein
MILYSAPFPIPFLLLVSELRAAGLGVEVRVPVHDPARLATLLPVGKEKTLSRLEGLWGVAIVLTS